MLCRMPEWYWYCLSTPLVARQQINELIILFREIVNASHLNPLERKDVMDTARKQPWNMVAHLGRGEAMSEGPQAGTEDQHSSTLPKNGQDFMRAWRQLKHKGSIDQYKYVNLCLRSPMFILLQQQVLAEHWRSWSTQGL